MKKIKVNIWKKKNQENFQFLIYPKLDKEKN